MNQLQLRLFAHGFCQPVTMPDLGPKREPGLEPRGEADPTLMLEILLSDGVLGGFGLQSHFMIQSLIILVIEP